MSEFVDHLAELFEEFGPVAVRRMFGGHGIFRDGVMFGLVVDDALYLKADEHNRALFESSGLPRFEYTRKGKRVSLSYCLAPSEALDDPGTLAEWARPAFDAALRAKRVKRR
ncbi:MAG: TfoX/Sxy family protein [Thiotrichales bacterium]|nr:TfoX/Sxy family protein [Thiotrichales bacterium]